MSFYGTIMDDVFYTLVNLSIGKIGLIWSQVPHPHLVRVVLPDEGLPTGSLIRKLFPSIKERSQTDIDAVIQQLKRYDQGNDFTFPLDLLGMEGWSEFYRRVWLETSRIPLGKVTTYGHLARRIRAPRAARAVGTALARNPFPIIIPCHRIIQANGKPGRYSSGGERMKRRLLTREGLVFDARGMILLKDCI